MPVPKRRNKSTGVSSSSIVKMPMAFMKKALDINYVFQLTRPLLLYGFAPTVVLIGMYTEPQPGSWIEAVDILGIF